MDNLAYICRNLIIVDMKRIIISLVAVLAFTSIHANNSSDEAIPVIENQYLEYVLEQNFLASQLGDRDFIITSFLSENMKKFHTADLIKFKEAIKEMNDQELLALSGADFKDPTVSLVLSIIVGQLGIDRFYIGDVGAGVGKLLTLGGLGIWWIIDMFTIQKKTKTNNAEELNETMMLNQMFMTE